MGNQKLKIKVGQPMQRQKEKWQNYTQSSPKHYAQNLINVREYWKGNIE